jgi:hypothetical protein
MAKQVFHATVKVRVEGEPGSKPLTEAYVRRWIAGLVKGRRYPVTIGDMIELDQARIAAIEAARGETK